MQPPVGPVLGQRRSSAWTHVSWGLHRPRQHDSGLREDLDAWRLVLPTGGCFTHLTAASAYGWWLPPLPPDLPVFAALPVGANRIRRDGFRATRHPVSVQYRVVDGRPLSSPAETLLACARDLAVLDMVVLLDSALHARQCSLHEVRQILELRRRGTPVLREALELADRRAESPWETLLRVLHVACDVAVEPQRVLVDDDGRFLARCDLHLVGTRTLHEYDGGVHREKGQHRKDLVRERRLGDGGWMRRGYTDVEVMTQPVSILRDADRALGRPHEPERIRAWHAVIAASTFTPSGRSRFRVRLGLPASNGRELRMQRSEMRSP